MNTSILIRHVCQHSRVLQYAWDSRVIHKSEWDHLFLQLVTSYSKRFLLLYQATITILFHYKYHHRLVSNINKCYHRSLAQSRMSYRTWQSLPLTKYKAPVVLQFLLCILHSDQEPGDLETWTQCQVNWILEEDNNIYQVVFMYNLLTIIPNITHTYNGSNIPALFREVLTSK